MNATKKWPQGVGSSNLLAPTNLRLINQPLIMWLLVSTVCIHILSIRQKLIYFLRFCILMPFLFAFQSDCLAGETWLDLNLTSIHTKHEQHLNQENYGAGVEYHQSADVLYMAGAYRNSYDKNSVYALAGWTPIEFNKVKIGAVAGAITGYDACNNGGIAPIAAGLIRIEGNRIGVNIVLIPPASRHDPAAIGLQVKYKY